MKRLLTLAVMFICCMATSFAQFSGSGSGTENDPYLILNPIQLNQIRNFPRGAYFKLLADIDLTEFIEDEYPNVGWLPINIYGCNLDGNGKTISGLWINRDNTDEVGLFRFLAKKAVTVAKTNQISLFLILYFLVISEVVILRIYLLKMWILKEKIK